MVDKQDLINWVTDFLYEYDVDGTEPGGTGMPTEEAAEIIVNQILLAQRPLSSDRKKNQNGLPNPSSFFHVRQVR